MNEINSPKTPISTTNQKSTPTISTGHFTPCRQMGLSRKRKKSMSSIASPLHIPDDNIVTESNITPKNDILQTRVTHGKKKRNLNVLLSNVVTDVNIDDDETLLVEINACKTRINEKKKIIDELKRTQRIDNTNKDLQDLIVKWRHGCQNALCALLDEIQKNSNTHIVNMNSLLKDLNIPENLIHYDTENETFM